MSGGWFDWLPGFLGGSGGSAAMPPETFGPKAPLPPPDPTGIIGMVPGGMQQQVPSTVSPTSMAFTPGQQKGGWQNQLAAAMRRYQQAQGSQQQQPQQHMSTWFGPRRIG